MRVAMNGLALRPDGAGVSTYIRELVGAMDARWRGRLRLVVQKDAAADLPSDVETVRVPVCSGGPRAALGALLRPRAQLYHGLDVDLPWLGRGPTVSTVHDMAVFDVPWAFSASRLRGEQLLVRHAITRADVVLADSAFTAERIQSLLGREARVVPLAAPTDLKRASAQEVQAARERYRLPEQFVFHVGTVEPRKDIARLAEVCRDAGVPLVLAGGRLGPDAELGTGIVRLGYVPRHDLSALYGAASVVAYCSVYEGFGLPPLEALTCGALLMCSRVADLPELVGAAAVWTSPGNLASLQAGLRRALHDPDVRAETAEALPTALAATSWARTARAVQDVYAGLA